MEHLQQLRQRLASWGEVDSPYNFLQWWNGYATGAKLPYNLRDAGNKLIADHFFTKQPTE